MVVVKTSASVDSGQNFLRTVGSSLGIGTIAAVSIAPMVILIVGWLCNLVVVVVVVIVVVVVVVDIVVIVVIIDVGVDVALCVVVIWSVVWRCFGRNCDYT